jgi:hypothetical protein
VVHGLSKDLGGTIGKSQAVMSSRDNRAVRAKHGLLEVQCLLELVDRILVERLVAQVIADDEVLGTFQDVLVFLHLICLLGLLRLLPFHLAVQNNDTHRQASIWMPTAMYCQRRLYRETTPKAGL